jgi:hypothetical protein
VGLSRQGSGRVAARVRHPGFLRAADPRMITRRARRLGLALAAATYVLAAAITAVSSGHPVRPLFEGIGPAPPYRWVNPPRQFKATNISPLASTQSVALTSAGSPQAGVSTIDGQLVLALAAGAFPAASGQTSVEVATNPHDPAKLGVLPAGLFPDGNAYEVRATYRPSGTAITQAAHPVDAIIETPAPAETVLLSTDGKTWQPIATHHIPGRAAVATTFSKFGYLMAAASSPVDVTGSGSSGVWTYLLPILLGLVAIGLVTAALLWRRRSRQAATSSTRSSNGK